MAVTLTEQIRLALLSVEQCHRDHCRSINKETEYGTRRLDALEEKLQSHQPLTVEDRALLQQGLDHLTKFLDNDDHSQPPQPQKQKPQDYYEIPISDLTHLYNLYITSDQSKREQIESFFELVGLPMLVSVPQPQPPESVTPHMAIAALTRLMSQSQALAQENIRVMLGIKKIENESAHRLLQAGHASLTHYQSIIALIRSDMQAKEEIV